MHAFTRQRLIGFRSPAVVMIGVVALFLAAAPALAQINGTTQDTRTLLDFIQAGGVIGYLLILLSVVGVALVVDAYLRLDESKLIPPALVDQAVQLAERRRFTELLGICRTNDTLLGRILGNSLAEGNWGLDAVREAMVQHGRTEITRLNHRIGYIGFIASIAPMLGLLGTVTGMIDSFDVLGESKGAARPDELAVGISEALVTTCMGLAIAIPLMFFHSLFRDRVTRIGQRAAGVSERLLRIMAVVLDNHARAQQAATAGAAGLNASTGRPPQAQPSTLRPGPAV